MNDRLHRSVDDRMLAGVAGGLAEYWDADPSLIRVLWVILAFATGGIAFVVYIVMAIVVPEEEHGAWAGYSAPGGPGSAEPPPPAAGPAPARSTAADTTTVGVPSASAGHAVSQSASGPDFAVPPYTSAREARRAAREARRAARGDRRSPMGGVVVGIFFVLLGAFFLLREFLPQIRWDWFWPLILIAIGVLILVAAVGRPGEDQGSRR